MDDELIKSLRICSDQGKCNGCKYDEIDIPSCHNPLMREAADAIEELQKQLDVAYSNGYKRGVDDAAEVDLAKKMSYWWIPVTERLPEDKERVLIFYWLSTKPKTPWYKVATFATKLCDVDEYDFYGKDHPGFYGSDSEYGYYEHTVVEYWMPLPQPPESEG